MALRIYGPVATFHFHNMFLIGDACHPLLSMTSQGVNTALEDAIHLAQLFNDNDHQDVGIYNIPIEKGYC